MEELLGYTILETLKQGRGIHVFRGEHRDNHSFHIVKALVSGSPEQVAAFHHEYQINHSFQSPGVVHCQQIIEKGDRRLLVFEDTRGITLSHYLDGHSLDLETFFPIALEMVSCLEDLHSNKVIHKDIKPDNVLVNPEKLAVKLIDLSIATQLESEIHEAVSVDKLEGSLAYIAPEQTGRMNRPMDYRSDYYSLGFTFYEMLTGQLPFVCEDALGYVHAHMARLPKFVSTVNPNVPEMLSKIVAKLVNKQAEDRYQSTEGLRADLERCFQEWRANKSIPEFPLGEHEAYYKLVMSPKIFGRENEIAALMSTFERASRGASECLLISGNSGVGKSRLVNEIQRPISQNKGFFIRGKFDLLQRSTPYTAFIEAFTNLFKHWLCQPEAIFQERRKKLSEAMGQYGQVIVEFFPYLEKVMGKQPEIDKLPPEQAQNRFLYHFQNFIECMASPDEPVVMFIDDLQWIDQGSLRLLEIMLTTQDVQSLLFIGTYRDNEVDESHPFVKLMDKIKKANGNVKDIFLKPLKLAHTQEFLSDSLHMNEESVLPLAEMVFDKTAGNPFFTQEFLKECFSQKFLNYNHKECRWTWELEKIANMAGTDNVIDLILTKISQLPEMSQRLLQVGSCLGMNFDSNALIELCKINVLEVAEALSPVLKAGMIQRIGNDLRYKFIHDRVQQATYQTISDEEKRKLHLTVGRKILKGMKETGTNNQLFEALDHFQLSADLLIEGEERVNIAELCLSAGLKANDSGAYQAAEEYLTFGNSLLDILDSKGKHPLAWNINMQLAYSMYYQGKSEETLKMIEQLWSGSKKDIDTLKVYILQMSVYHNLLRDYTSTLEIAKKATLLFPGWNLTFHNPSKAFFILRYLTTSFKLGRGEHFLKSLQNPKCVNEDEAELMIGIAYMVGSSLAFQKRYLTLYMSMLDSALYQKYVKGNYSGIPMTLSIFGQISYFIRGDLREFEIYFRSAVDFIEHHELSTPAKAEANFGILLNSGYFMSLSDISRLGEQTVQSTVDGGRYAYLSRSISLTLANLSYQDAALLDIKSKATEYLKLARKIKLNEVEDLVNYTITSSMYLIGTRNNVVTEAPNPQVDYGLFYIFNAYLSEDYSQAYKSMAMNDGVFTTTSCLPKIFYNAISIIIFSRLYPGATGSEKRKYIKKIKQFIKALKKVADYNPSNFLHLYLIGQAELARIKGEKNKALKLYEKAIAAAKEHDYLRWTAIANERAGELYLEMGEDTIASVYIHEAIYYYQHWGCMLKVRALNRRYSALLIEKHLRKDPKDIKPGETGTSGEGELDLTAMLKASQAISSEIQLDKLLPRILQVVVESSGADKAAFIGLNKENWVIESVTEHKGDEFTSTTMNELLTPDSDLPEDFISNAIRSDEIEVIHDLSQSEKYASLPYVQQYRTKSALCLPIVRDAKVLAALYLENQKTADTFTPERVQLLKSLSAQISISLENARYFERTQDLFRSTERFVPKKFLELLGRNNIEEVAKGDNVKLEMSAIFADLRDFTAISESIEPEQLTFVLNTYLKYMSPIIRNNHGFVNRVLGDGILALFPNDPQDAVNASLEMLEALTPFNQEINAAGFETIKMGIGVNTGPAMLCALGEDERIEANVVSDMVNAASRIEGLNKLYGTTLLISDLTYNKLKDLSKFSIRLVDTVRVKGKTKPLSLYEVMPKTQDESYFEDFQKALNLYTEGKFKAANQNFIKCLKVNPDDAVAQLYAERCKTYQDNTPDNWDGVTTMLEK